MLFGLDVAQHQLTWDALRTRVRYAEDAGFDGAWVFDHFTALYGTPTGPCLEGWTLLAALAAVTERIRLGTLVTGVTHRHPSVLVTEAVTVDHVSNGRLELALGAAWNEGEHQALGIDFPPLRERAERLEEAVEIVRALMTKDHVSYDGRYYRLDDATYRPRPVQKPHPPIWIGAAGPKITLPIVGRQADVWHCYGSIRQLEKYWEIVETHAEKAGRNPDRIARATDLDLSQPMDKVRKDIEHADNAGWTYLTVGWPSEGRRRLDSFVEKVMPAFSE
ncbi:MAG: TIGR03560 family F420-dependent LLM class oxidoreductase [Actinomycetota bacterium]